MLLQLILNCKGQSVRVCGASKTFVFVQTESFVIYEGIQFGHMDIDIGYRPL
jgi:hypothetical protein